MRTFIRTGSLSFFNDSRIVLSSTLRISTALVALAVTAVLLIPAPSYAQSFSPSVTQTFGTGPDEAYLVVNFDDGLNGADNPSSDYVFGYDWNPTTSSPSELDAINEVFTNSPASDNASYSTQSYSGFGDALLSLSYDGHVGDGWLNSYWALYSSDGSRLGVDPTDWDYASLGIDETPLTNDGYYGMVFTSEDANGLSSSYPLVAAAAPETSSFLGVMTGLFILTAMCFGIVGSKRKEVSSN